LNYAKAWSAGAGIALAALLTAALPPANAAVVVGNAWDFAASLDGKPIGEHRFGITVAGHRRTVVSEADFAVKFLGITAYRYHHKAVEQWRGDCLDGLVATTQDGGKSSSVHAEADGGSGLEVSVDSAAAQPMAGCVMSFAYWNPAIRAQTRLLNAQTGRLETIQVERVGDAPIDVRGQAMTATQWRITGATQPIDVWYSAQGEWVGLDSTVEGGRKLSYRLK
jgi:hypothetical protein